MLTILSTIGGTIVALGVIAKGTLWILNRQYVTQDEHSEDMKEVNVKHTELLVAITEVKILIQGLREYIIGKKEDPSGGA